MAGRPWRRLTERERREWATAIAAGVIVDRASEAILVAGPCPVCDHGFSVVLTEKEVLAELDNGLKGIGGADGGGRVDWAARIEFLAACHCEEGHEGRPSVIGHGCGASGWFVDEPDA